MNEIPSSTYTVQFRLCCAKSRKAETLFHIPRIRSKYFIPHAYPSLSLSTRTSLPIPRPHCAFIYQPPRVISPILRPDTGLAMGLEDCGGELLSATLNLLNPYSTSLIP